jgi:hypothetical protein
MGWADWTGLLNNQLSPNILLGAHSNYWLKNRHVQNLTNLFSNVTLQPPFG